MAHLPYLKMFAADWLADPKVSQLTLEEQGFYFRLLMLMWVQYPGWKLENNPEKIAKSFPNNRRKIANLLAKLCECLGETLPIIDGYICSPRLKQEIASAQEISEKRSEAGKLGGRPKKANAFPEESKPKSYSQSQSESESDKSKTPLTPQGGESVFASLPVQGGEFRISESLITEWEGVYDCDIRHEVKAAIQWAKGPRNKNGLKKDGRRFLTNWLKRVHDKRAAAGGDKLLSLDDAFPEGHPYHNAS